MHVSRIFIERPIMTTLVTFAILLVWRCRIPRFAGRGASERGLPDDSGVGGTARRQSGNDGVFRRDAAGARILDDRRRPVDQFLQHTGRHDHHDSVRSRS